MCPRRGSATTRPSTRSRASPARIAALVNAELLDELRLGHRHAWGKLEPDDRPLQPGVGRHAGPRGGRRPARGFLSGGGDINAHLDMSARSC